MAVLSLDLRSALSPSSSLWWKPCFEKAGCFQFTWTRWVAARSSAVLLSPAAESMQGQSSSVIGARPNGPAKRRQHEWWPWKHDLWRPRCWPRQWNYCWILGSILSLLKLNQIKLIICQMFYPAQGPCYLQVDKKIIRVFCWYQSGDNDSEQKYFSHHWE